MRARITVALVSILAIALVLAGAVSLTLVRDADYRTAKSSVLTEALAVAKTPNASAANVNYLINVLQTIGVIAGAPLVSRDKNGHLTITNPPPGISLPADAAGTLIEGKSITGISKGQTYAIVPLLKTNNGWFDFSLTTEAHPPNDIIWYFLLAGGISLLVAGLVAAVISERISRHVVAAAGAARRIARDDLTARVPASHNYPELADLGSSINTMAESLQRAQNLHREFLLSVSHDLRTPLTSIRGYAEAIADGLVDDSQRAAAVVVAEAARLARLIGDLLDLAKIDANQFSTHMAPVDVRAEVQRAGEALRYEFEGTEVNLVISTGDDDATINADPDRLRQIIGNLVDNARKFAASEVRVSLRLDPDHTTIEVADDGPGIDPADIGQVFDRHFSSSRRAARAAGSGLGLAIVAELAGAMGGRVDAESPSLGDHGTRMTITLPRFDVATTGEPDHSLAEQR